jgi:arylsulfatase A
MDLTCYQQFVSRCSFSAALCCLSLLSCADVRSEEARPNVLIVICDDLGYGDLGCFGHPKIQTPNLDRLATQGMKLTSCYASSPVCSPSRCGLLTGRTPTRYGVEDWIPEKSTICLPAREVTFARLLRDHGYDTCCVGKWHCNGKFNSPEQPQPNDHGFDYWFATQNNALPNHRNPINFFRNGEAAGKILGYSSTIVIDEAIRWLNRGPRDRPFCLVVYFHSPHEIVATANEFSSTYREQANVDQAEYFGNVTQMDFEVGRLMRQLDEQELSQNTFVFFTSDNGPETLNRYAAARRSYGSTGGLRGRKLSLYEGGIRVPGILRWPGHVAAKSVSDEPVINTDLLPTLCDLAAAETPTNAPLDGVSWKPLFRGAGLGRREPLYWNYPKATDSWTIAIRQGNWKLLCNPDNSRCELYDVVRDRNETANLAESTPDQVELLLTLAQQTHQAVKRDREDSTER